MEKKIKADRAKQFLPFDSLKGFREAIKEKETIYVDKIELPDEDKLLLSDVISSLRKNTMVEITHYKKKQYIKICGLISDIDPINKTLHVVKEKIEFDNILKIDVVLDY